LHILQQAFLLRLLLFLFRCFLGLLHGHVFLELVKKSRKLPFQIVIDNAQLSNLLVKVLLFLEQRL
jgi:hypothetical protein